MKYSNIVEGNFISRPNRFVAEVMVDDQLCTVHMNNTGRCQELLIEGVPVILKEADNPNRKTKYDLIAVYREDYGWINIDSVAPNEVVAEYLASNPELLPGITFVKPEFTYGDSRVDFYFEQNDVKNLLEVKGCTLVKKGIGMFPDAPTTRGLKHVRELTSAVVEDGINAYVAFVIQVNNIDYVIPNREIQPEFADALRDAVASGVKLLFIRCEVTKDELKVRNAHIIDHL